MSTAMRIKQLVRPLIPDRLMARYRLAQHSRQVRTNVDVVLTDPGERRRWLGSTPDTYRVVGAPSPAGPPSSMGHVEVFGSDTERAAELLGVPEAEVGVVARVAAPRIVGRRRTEPPMEPIGIATTTEAVDEVGGVPDGEAPLSGLLDRLRDAGRRIALLPVPVQDSFDPSRTDPIGGPPVVILAAVPMYDIGGGSRATQLAVEFVRRGYHVTYVALYGTQESADLGLRFIHPHLEQVRADGFVPTDLLARIEGPGLVIVEMPASGFRSSVEILQGKGWTVVYDVIDDWSDPSLGGEWYDADIEAGFVRAADHVTASAVDLATRARGMGAEALVVPNGVNTDLFGPGSSGDLPHDFPRGDGSVLGYVGSLYGEWFDWGALQRVAAAFPDARVVVVGDDRGGHPEMPPNVSFLGLKAQFDLPRYVSRFNVGLLPFVVSDMTHAVSPLKVYEYLASGVPVAAPPLRSLDGLDGVFADIDLVEAVRCALEGDAPDVTSVVDRHSWAERVAKIIDLARFQPAMQSTPVRIVRRPATHYTKRARTVNPQQDLFPPTE